MGCNQSKTKWKSFFTVKENKYGLSQSMDLISQFMGEKKKYIYNNNNNSNNNNNNKFPSCIFAEADNCLSICEGQHFLVQYFNGLFSLLVIFINGKMHNVGIILCTSILFMYISLIIQFFASNIIAMLLVSFNSFNFASNIIAIEFQSLSTSSSHLSLQLSINLFFYYFTVRNKTKIT